MVAVTIGDHVLVTGKSRFCHPGQSRSVVAHESVVFFFSSRRRHTRCSRDWSSDVCSSDLIVPRHSHENEQITYIPEAQAAFENVSNLLVLVRMTRHNRALLEIDMGQHHADRKSVV